VTYVALTDERVREARQRWPQMAHTVIQSAQRVISHEFDLLGSGPFTPIDKSRPLREAYQPIDWYLDPVRRLRFPTGVPHKEWKLYEMRPGNADIKYPWELARCQHWVTLGQAYRLTGDERFAREIKHQLDDFVDANPVGIGINWTCTMDVGLRAANWLLGLDLVRGSAELDDDFWQRAYDALFDHGVFIRHNLENTYEVTSNHFLSNVVGLWFLGAAIVEHPAGAEWRQFARTALEQEVIVQVLPDGADFESAVPYHRLVAELFLGSLRLADTTGSRLSELYRTRVRDMVGYLTGVLRPDGLMPQCGDADDGRLHVLNGVATTTPQDPRHLLGPAAMMFDAPDWLRCGGELAGWEAAWWGFDVPVFTSASLPPVRHLFKDAGHAVIREGGNYLLVTNSIVGTKGFGNHKHNDQLGFEYHVDGTPIVVDPGSYVYTSDPAARNLFRSTGYHSTLQVDGVEQNEFNPEWLFRMFESSRAEHLAFAERDGWSEYHGRHRGYERLAEPVVHERRFQFEPATAALAIADVLTGAGQHRLQWHFHLGPGATVALDREQSCLITNAGVAVRLSWTAAARATLTDAWYSPSYGVRVACQALDLAIDATLTGTAEWSFSFQPEAVR
jgi:uncharacterized heparinase superfamily protein